MADKIAPYINPILNVLRRVGGSERRKNIITAVVQDLGLQGSSVLDETLRSGVSAFENKLVKALRYLNMAGYVENSAYGRWALTEKGRASPELPEDEVAQLLAEVRSSFGIAGDPGTVDEEDDTSDEIAHKPALLDTIRRLPPSGFERLCKHLLSRHGFDPVVVTGGSGDGGIDGYGVLRVNPFVSFKVLFQCKRYDAKNKVGSPEVQKFRGAMHGRSEKGLLLTTGAFTSAAIEEASREGVPQIELVDGERLVGLFESLQLGLIPRQAYDVDVNFFSQFASPNLK